MNMWLAASAVVALIVGLVHSVLGEMLIFRPLARQKLRDQTGGLRVGYVNIMWASWHIVTVFGWGLAALLMWYAMAGADGADIVVISGISIVTCIAAGLVLWATKGRHPGWAGLLAVAVLAALGINGGNP